MSFFDKAAYLFHQGTDFFAYDHLGCVISRNESGFLYTFRTWAPNAGSVSLVSDFTDWNFGKSLAKITENGIWECVIESETSLVSKSYKYRIESKSGVHLKGDPFAKFSKGGSDGASVIYEDGFVWSDKSWLKYRKTAYNLNKKNALSLPINIYEIHLGSFIRHEDGSFYTYRELAEVLPQYVKSLGYTHVEFMPLAEYPFDGSWGYQVCGFYAPTSRYGTPADLKFLINSLHELGIGVIIDWVPAHFPKDEWGLFEYDGAPLFEYQGTDRRESETWGTRFFDLGREEIQSFLISNALYYFREFHVDGLRVDAVASMLYLDYDRSPGKWIPNVHGGRENLEAIAFFKKLNSAINSEFPDVLMIAEESGSYGGITAPTESGGLGFTLKWNMGWANDFYAYLETDPLFRKYEHKALNFPLMYAFSERYVMPVSHDEVVHGKKSLVNKPFGEYEDKFRQMRAALLLMYTYPGKKMLFMGCEFAQFREWNYDDSLEWFMLEYKNHSAMRDYVSALNTFYLSSPELFEIDFDPEGFFWLLPDENEKNLVAFKRRRRSGEEISVIINFSGSEQRISTDIFNANKLKNIFSTSPGLFDNEYVLRARGKTVTLDLCIPAFSGVAFKEIKNKKIKLKGEPHHVL